MLHSLKIKNIAIIDELSVDFSDGFNVLIGETGAGKSIVIDSLSFLLGNRADKSLIRSGELSGRVDGVFSLDRQNPAVQTFFEKIGQDLEDEALISRTINAEGKSETRVNGQMITAGLLRELTAVLVDIYAQNESQFLLKPKNQLHLLDGYGKIKKTGAYANYQVLLNKLSDLNSKLSAFGGSLEERAKEIEYLTFQMDEISLAKLSVDEEKELSEKKKKYANLEKILLATNEAENTLTSGVSENINYAVGRLHQAAGYDEILRAYHDRLESLNIELKDILESVSDYNRSSDYSPEEFNRIDERLDVYKGLERKYSVDIAGVLVKFDEMKERKQELLNATEIVSKLTLDKQKLLLELFAQAEAITKLRKTFAMDLCGKVIGELKDLGMPNATLSFEFAGYENKEEKLLSDGMDVVELQFSANLGEPAKSLGSIISGGEMSRLMLAVKAVVAGVDDMPTMIFDEIDTGISGKMAQAVARKMAIISRSHQVLAITHSSQIAAMSDHAYLIFKLTQNGKTVSRIKCLNEAEKSEEVAKFMSGDTTSNFAINSALELISEQAKFKSKIK